MEDETTTITDNLEREGKRHLKIGAGLGVLSIGAIATFGAIACPFCVVACPAFVASGALKLKKAKQSKSIGDQLA